MTVINAKNLDIDILILENLIVKKIVHKNVNTLNIVVNLEIFIILNRKNANLDY